MADTVQSTMFLNGDEIRALTKRIQYSAQVRVLRAMGIEHRMRPDGSLAILRAHIDQIFGGFADRKKLQTVEPNWGALNATRT